MSKTKLAWGTHRLYEKGDAGAPDVIKDRNGDIVLSLCKDCGRGECELDDPCTEPSDELVDAVVDGLLEGFGATEDYETAIAALQKAGLSGATAMRVMAAICGYERDAERWRTVTNVIGAWLSGGRRQVWSLEALPIPEGVNLMKGSVAEHFANAVDAVIRRGKAK